MAVYDSSVSCCWAGGPALRWWGWSEGWGILLHPASAASTPHRRPLSRPALGDSRRRLQTRGEEWGRLVSNAEGVSRNCPQARVFSLSVPGLASGLRLCITCSFLLTVCLQACIIYNKTILPEQPRGTQLDCCFCRLYWNRESTKIPWREASALESPGLSLSPCPGNQTPPFQVTTHRLSPAACTAQVAFPPQSHFPCLSQAAHLVVSPHWEGLLWEWLASLGSTEVGRVFWRLPRPSNK